jgi:hypothetical protein
LQPASDSHFVIVRVYKAESDLGLDFGFSCHLRKHESLSARCLIGLLKPNMHIWVVHECATFGVGRHIAGCDVFETFDNSLNKICGQKMSIVHIPEVPTVLPLPLWPTITVSGW